MTTIHMLAQAAPADGLTLGGAVVMTGSFTIVAGLAGFCLYRIMRESSPGDHHHAPLDIDTRDRDT